MTGRGRENHCRQGGRQGQVEKQIQTLRQEPKDANTERFPKATLAFAYHHGKSMLKSSVVFVYSMLGQPTDGSGLHFWHENILSCLHDVLSYPI